MRTTLVTVRLRLCTPGGVTAPEEQRWEDTDDEGRVRNVLRLRRDPFGTPHLPGTTIAGSLRAHCADTPVLADAFGPPPGTTEPAASPIQVLGAIIRDAPETTTTTRTAIDRHSGAARTRTLRATERLPAGTEFDVYLRWDDPPPGALDVLRDRLRTWTPTLGRGASIGAGRCVTLAFGERGFDLASAAGLLDWLALRGPADYPAPDTPVTSTPPTTVVRRVTMRIADALHIGAGSTHTGEHDQQVADVVRSGDDVVVPGSTIKGVLRSRVEYICRVLGHDACDDAACGHCRPCHLFGHATRDRAGTPRRASIAIPDAIVRRPVREHRQHVALDRFTGGARPEALFTNEVVVAGTFDITIEQLAELHDADLALLDAALRDLHDGLVGIGARTTAGYGTVRIADDRWTAPDLGALTDLLKATTP